jgi:hypothetical protein
MQLKSRQVLLYIAACAGLYISELPGGSLLAIAVLMQMTLLLKQFNFSRRSQIAMFKLFLFSVPLFFFWGATHSFITIYLKEGLYFMAFSAAVLNASLTFVLTFQLVFTMNYLVVAEYHINGALQNAFNEIKNHLSDLVKTTALIFVLSFVPVLHEDWKMVFALTATLAYLNRSQLKLAFFQP